MIFRRSLQHVTSRESYLSGDAHPAAFEGYTINPARMVSLAQSIEPDAIPPEVRIAVTAEDLGTEGVDYFGEGLSEQLFDTPGAIARIWRSKAATRTMTVSAAETRDPNGRPLDFHWRLLQGDPEKVTIEPLRGRHQRDDHPRLARPLRHLRGQPGHHRPASTSASSPRTASTTAPRRSSPGTSPRPRSAALEPGPDGALRTAAIDHANPDRAYADPILVPRADWRDDFAYDAGGTLLGWTRVRGDRRRPKPSTPTAGACPTRRTPPPRSPVAYPLSRAEDGRLVVEEVDAAPF